MVPPPATYAVEDTVPPIRGKPTTSLQATAPHHLHQPTGHATPPEETNNYQKDQPGSFTTQTNKHHHQDHEQSWFFYAHTQA